MINKTFAKNLLWCGVIAGPLYVFTSLIEIMIRPGFDITRHSWSLLSNGSLGWIHVANFIITGWLVIAAAAGMKYLMRNEKAGTWGPRLLTFYGISLIAAGFFKADPVAGFPPGAQIAITTSGILHLVSGLMGFSSLIAACFIFTRRFHLHNQKGWELFSLITGLYFFFAFAGIAIFSAAGDLIAKFVTIGFILAVILSFSWLMLLSLSLSERTK